MKHEIHLFFNALAFYTRIPSPNWVNYSEKNLNEATRYFPLIGVIVGIISGVTFLMFLHLFDSVTASICSLTISLLITGAFHEDGLADMLDGFGGGWTKEKILTIMKDSRVGTYGVVGLFLLFMFKVNFIRQLSELSTLKTIFVFILIHVFSRLSAMLIIFQSNYSREDEKSKAKPIAKSASSKTIIISFIVSLLILIVFIFVFNKYVYILSICPIFFISKYLQKYYEKWIDGYTGDCLGACQQISEILILATFIYIHANNSY